VEELRKVEGLSIEELEAQRIELLPDREEMQNRLTREPSANRAAHVGCRQHAWWPST
jgi:hypothetical protein